jgi:glycosyltransferase involved in cell wall biosynthesis
MPAAYAPDVSIVLPVFFGQSSVQNKLMLSRALESVYDQQFPGEFEIVIVDDGSITPVETMAPSIGALASRVKWHRVSGNCGLVNALNLGIGLARYAYIARLDVDDRWLPSKVEKQFNLFASNPAFCLTATGMTRVRADGSHIDTHVRPGSWSGILTFLVNVGSPFPHGSVIARRDIFRLLGGYSHNARVRHCEDLALWCRWLRFFEAAMVEEPLYEYAVSASSVSGLNADKQKEASDSLRNWFAHLGLADHLPITMRSFADMLGISVIQAGVLCWRMWFYGTPVALPSNTINLLACILPDRHLRPLPDIPVAKFTVGGIVSDFGSVAEQQPRGECVWRAYPTTARGEDAGGSRM